MKQESKKRNVSVSSKSKKTWVKPVFEKMEIEFIDFKLGGPIS